MTTNRSKTRRFLDSLVDDPLTLGSLLVSIRQCDEVSQAELAKRLGISKSHLCDIERGRKSVSPERAARFARELGYGEEPFVRLALQQMLEVAGLKFQVVLTLDKAAKSMKRAPAKRGRAA